MQIRHNDQLCPVLFRLWRWGLGLWLGLLPFLSQAHNVQLRDAQLVTPQSLAVALRWEQSWSLADGRHDAIWLFAKYRSGPDAAWLPLRLSSDSMAHTGGADTEVRAVADEMGVMVRLAQPGSGLVDWQSIVLQLATPLAAGGSIDLAVYAIEMAYVLPGPFWLGDSSSYHHFRAAETGGSFWVSDESLVPLNAWSVGDVAQIGGALPAAYPKGTEGFYMMKYEISQAQYRDFLNSLLYAQQVARAERMPSASVGTAGMVPAGLSSARNGVVILQPGQGPDIPAIYACDAQPNDGPDMNADGQTRACNFLGWADLLAYLDWAGLSPLTELAFEKACRGPMAAIPGEFAWGTPGIIDANTVLADGTAQESVQEQASATAGLASHGYAGPQGPLRNGFGASALSNRLQSGGGYYGHLELSGNLWELCVGVSSPALAFDGQHGDGLLDSAGAADVAHWPLAGGGIHRGGGFFSGILGDFRDLAISDRFYHDLHPAARRHTTGGRGVRWH